MISSFDNNELEYLSLVQLVFDFPCVSDLLHALEGRLDLEMIELDSWWLNRFPLRWYSTLELIFDLIGKFNSTEN